MRNSSKASKMLMTRHAFEALNLFPASSQPLWEFFPGLGKGLVSG